MVPVQVGHRLQKVLRSRLLNVPAKAEKVAHLKLYFRLLF